MTARSIVRRWRGALAALCGGAVALAAGAAGAQSVDVRMIRPNVMLLLDTSGSMEWRVGADNATCTGADGGPCNQCTGGAPLCSSTCQVRNRWATAIEVLTGTINNFTCSVGTAPRGYAINDADNGYMVPYHQPLSGGVSLLTATGGQQTNGIMDTYRDRVRFGLMTFDNAIDARNTSAGLWSYPSGVTDGLRPNGCATTTQINLGIRREPMGTEEIPGGLVSVGRYDADSAALSGINASIQTSIQQIRPFGGTPIAAMLADAYTYWTSHAHVVSGASGDPYYACRPRFNVLLTDGQPNMDFRPACDGGGCPYDAPSVTASMLANNMSGPNVKTYVIAFNAGTTTELDLIAANGGTTAALNALDSTSLTTALSNVLDRIAASTSTRTAPAFGAQQSSTTGAQYQFQSSFLVNSGQPWEGVLERRRSECAGTPLAPVERAIVQNQDDFGYLLRAAQRTSNMWGTRKLWTYIPTGVTTAAGLRATFTRTAGSAAAARTLVNESLAPAYFGTTVTATHRTELVTWLRGDAGTLRATRPLGAIYHSNPLVVAPPSTSLPDQTYAAYRARALSASTWRASVGTPAITVGRRETAVYVGTDDGILHAFNADTGEEIWGFIPPYLMGSIDSAWPSNHLDGVDGTPVAREVVYTRTATAVGDASSWRTVLLVGLRGNGAYVALDVTDPYNPSFLWQYTDADLANAYGTPAIGSIFTTWNGASARTERAVAILPGGQGTPIAAASCTATSSTGARPTTTTDARITVSGSVGTRRSQVRCWNGTAGQYVYVIDLETGQRIYKSGRTGSPVVGSPSLFVGTEGSVATRAYVGDADGGVWRLDMSDPDPANWQFGLAFDVFGSTSAAYNIGQPVTTAPIVSSDRNGDTLIAVGSGDPDLLEGTELNRVAVYRERITTNANGSIASIAVSNHWQLAGVNPATTATTGAQMYPGERLTGNISLFNGVLYFGTFVPSTSTTDLCQMGYSRLWGVDQVERDADSLPVPRLDIDGDPTTSDVVRVTRDINGNSDGGTDDLNSVLFGVGIVRRPSCVTSASATDPYVGGSRSWVESVSGGEFRLVAQTGRGGTSSGGSRTNVVSRPLPPPITNVRVDAWAVVFE